MSISIKKSAWTRADSLLCALLGLSALFLRLPELLTLPVFRDELAEVVRGLHIYQGLSYPLTNEALDIGALWNYMVAALFATTGPDPYTPRLLVALLGAATVSLTYALAWRLTRSTLVALVSGALLATNSMHILISHISWSNCTTPFWTTATLLALTPASAPEQPNRLPRSWALVLAGLLGGLALQSHSSVIAFLFGVAIWLWWPWSGLKERLRRPAFWLAHLALLLAYGNMIWFNIANPLASWYHVVEHKSYALAGADGAGSVGVGSGYPSNLAALLVEWSRANSADFTQHDQLAAYLTDPTFLIYGLLLLAGLVFAIRRRFWLLIASAVAIALILPLFNRDYQFDIHSRYIGFLFPIGAILSALPFAALESLWKKALVGSREPGAERRAPGAANRELGAENREPSIESREAGPANREPVVGNGQSATDNRQRTIGNRQPITANPPPATGNRQPATRPRLPAPGSLAVLLIAVPLALYPIFPLFNYYDQEIAAGRSNSSVIDLLGLLRAEQNGGAVAYTSKLPVAMSIGLGLDVWNIPHFELNDTNEPTLPPGEGGLDTPAVWKDFVKWTASLPPSTRDFAVAVPPAGADGFRAIGGDLPWTDAGTVRGSDGVTVSTVLRLPLSAAELAQQTGAQLKTELMLILPRAEDATTGATAQRIKAALATGQSVRVVILTAQDRPVQETRATLASLGLPADRLFIGGYPPDFLRSIAPGASTPDPEAPWTDPATGQKTTSVPDGQTIYQRLYGHAGAISAEALRDDLRGLAMLYTPAVILAPAADNADPLLAVAGKNAAYAARKAGVPIQTLP